MADAQDDWIAKRVDSALMSDPVADEVGLAVKTQLQETMREQILSLGELTSLAKTLLDAAGKRPDEELVN